MTLKKCYQTVSQNFKFQLKTKVQLLPVSQNSDWGQAQLLRCLGRDYSDSQLSTESSGNRLKVLGILYYAGITVVLLGGIPPFIA